MAQLVVPYGAKAPFGARLLSRRRTADVVSPAAPGTDAADPRTTRAHIRVLEAALEEQVRRVAELTDELVAARARPHEDVRRIAATVEGLRLAFGKDPMAQRLLARVDAALDRLVEPGELARVPLPRARAERPPVASPPVTTPERAEPADDAGEPMVLPVPAAPEPTVEPRRRRGQRR
ncbi:hypothetical protein DDE18_16060 [Nocardioides gansuensis]|uniref:Uncharacterized protein n=1 Tax=Nocardioides gansuensis TaxID=2138300 RepID=A0A2T8F731_9ACTN|nr:hypothetical protein [Nocardioides gansuensis]PVG81528.1 hypothetical protein DDE18_16060 [Nocardioides gansuensis]